MEFASNLRHEILYNCARRDNALVRAGGAGLSRERKRAIAAHTEREPARRIPEIFVPGEAKSESGLKG